MRGELTRALAGPDQAAVIDELQATMAVIEGYAEHVMDAAAQDDPGLAGMRARMDERRARRGGLADVIARALGMGMKLRQYELGKSWSDAVAADAGVEGLNRVWAEPGRAAFAGRARGAARMARAGRRRARRIVDSAPGHGFFTGSGVTRATLLVTNTCSGQLDRLDILSSKELRGTTPPEEVIELMAANGTTTKKTTQTSTQSSTAATKDERSIDTAVSYVRQTAERAVDVPVGAALTVAENVSETVKPWAEPTGREKELKQLRTQVSRELNKLERRGGQARRKATTRARSTRNRIERELKQRRNRVERTVKQNRTKAERELKTRRTQVEKTVKDVQSAVQERVGTTTAAS